MGYVLSFEVGKLDAPIAVYNIEVEECHTYFVGDGVLVHNYNWSSKEVRDAAKDFQNGATSVTVSNRSQAEELFLGLYQSYGYTNTTGMNPSWARAIQGGKYGTYHWDDIADVAGNLIGHGFSNPHNSPYLQIHTFIGDIIRIFFDS